MRRARRPVIAAVLLGSLAVIPSARADDKQQCMAASDQGQQLRDDGHYRRAREAFAACARDACPVIVRRDCVKWLADLDQAAPSVVVSAKGDKGDDLVEVKVTIDGVLLEMRLDGKPTPVDPGAHVFRYEAHGYPPVEERVVIHAGEKSRLLPVQFGAPAAPAAPSPPPTTAAPPPAESSETSGRAPQGVRTSAWVFGGIALVAFASEAYFGLSGTSDLSSLRGQPCAKTSSCPQSSVDSIRNKFTIADISLGVGVVSAALATYLFLAGPAAEPPRPASAQVGLVPLQGGGAATIVGRF
jgi:hypothetical protein